MATPSVNVGKAEGVAPVFVSAKTTKHDAFKMPSPSGDKMDRILAELKDLQVTVKTTNELVTSHEV